MEGMLCLDSLPRLELEDVWDDSRRPGFQEQNVLESENLTHVSLFLCPHLGDANRQISDLKFKLAKSEQEITALEQNVGVILLSPGQFIDGRLEQSLRWG